MVHSIIFGVMEASVYHSYLGISQEVHYGAFHQVYTICDSQKDLQTEEYNIFLKL